MTLIQFSLLAHKCEPNSVTCILTLRNDRTLIGVKFP